METALRSQGRALTVLARLFSPLVRFAEWAYGPLVPGLDLGLGILAGGWCALEVCKPALFDQGAFVGLWWLPDPMWISLHATLTVMHAYALIHPRWRNPRMIAAFASSWNWLFVAISLARVDFTTGVLAYCLAGFAALLGGIFLGGLPRRQA